jgi:hypothetical protein
MSIKDRIVGIDAVRGIAILGMFAAHVGSRTTWGWMWLFDGRSAATFAVLVGVSMTLLDRGHSLAHSRARIATRAILLIVLGLSLEELQTPVVCILVNTGLMMLVGMWALRARARTLIALAVVFTVVGPFVRVWLVDHTTGAISINPSIGLRPYPSIVEALWGFYPIVVWMAYVFVGILVGRVALGSPRALAGLAWRGIVLAAFGYGGSILIGGEQRGMLDTPSGWWKSASPHTYTPFEVTGNMGVTLTLIAVCCAIALIARWALIPFAAVGAMALTVYAGHIVAIWWMHNTPVYDPGLATLLWFWGVAIVGCVVWRFTLDRGPLERLLHWASMRVAGAETAGAVHNESGT